jgi:hypothetical protein
LLFSPALPKPDRRHTKFVAVAATLPQADGEKHGREHQETAAIERRAFAACRGDGLQHQQDGAGGERQAESECEAGCRDTSSTQEHGCRPKCDLWRH